MPPSHDTHHELPGRLQSAVFWCKTRILQWRRTLVDGGISPPRHRRHSTLQEAPVLAELRTPLWTQTTAAEFPLTAGKVQNLRVSASALNGLEIPSGSLFSFWHQIGRTQKSLGYVAGRELREGCLIPNVGGGLCQLSGLLYGAALDAGLEIVERHAHSRKIPGSLADTGRDATVYWNYVDLRFRAPFDWRLEVELTATHLVVRIRSIAAPRPQTAIQAEPLPDEGAPALAEASGDCLTCNMTACFRHPGATAAHGPSFGHSAFLLDARWPEFDAWCASHAHKGDHYLVPLNGKRWRKSSYAWTVPSGVQLKSATLQTFIRSWQQRRLPAQGGSRQRTLLAADEALAASYAKQLSPECRHLIISQNLLPFLWKAGVLGGRTFDVIMQRWPMAQLIAKLDAAARQNPTSGTLTDFRPPAELIRAETAALAAAGRIVTPHRAIASRFGSRALLLGWHMPEASFRERLPRSESPRFFFPASPLGRKGIHELATALHGSGALLDVLGRAREGGASDALQGVSWQQAGMDDLKSASALVLPAWIEHQPRMALRALAMGIPVIATMDCGLPDHPLLRTIARPDAAALKRALLSWLHPQAGPRFDKPVSMSELS